MKKIHKSKKLENVCYEIRGPVMKEAQRLEEEGFQILKLNIGNTAPFGLMAPDEMIHDVILNMPKSQGYCDSKGLFSARKAVMQYYQQKGLLEPDIEDIYIGNGVSELIVMTMQGLLNNGDEVLIPAPDYPLWTAAVSLSGGKPVHYICDEKSDWYPDIDDIRSKITDKTKAIVVINPNNPTGSVYSKEIVEQLVKVAVEKKLVLLADEIYEKIVYDDNIHYSPALMTDETLVITYNGLSKSYRAPGFRAGWMVLTGLKSMAADFIDGLDILANMRLCSNVPSQYSIQTALGGYQSINDLILPSGRLGKQRGVCYDLLTSISGISCVKPKGALYMFPKIDVKKFGIKSDIKFAFDLLQHKKMLIVQGSGFNWPKSDHFRIVFLPDVDLLGEAMSRLKEFLGSYYQEE
ncbi:MAG: pyridoxal phosphate-dependent aminotransferase [Spirochaetes bacterium]|nr:pyridoxal phosphate-dependent aminotransferase [Spirochaetota bacterium]MBN2769956.1 pyridoxal phosphate-dependent aminotransferase [Spirochaetota bacterium]